MWVWDRMWGVTQTRLELVDLRLQLLRRVDQLHLVGDALLLRALRLEELAPPLLKPFDQLLPRVAHVLPARALVLLLVEVPPRR